MTKPLSTTRRTFMKSSAAVGGALALGSTFNTAHAQGSEEIKVALVGCGGRGTGAVAQMFNTKGNVKLVSVADAFDSNAKRAIDGLKKRGADKVVVNADTTFTGLDAYKKAIDVDCDVVVIATPPGFKPQQFEYAVSKGKHVFCEKPVAADAPGIRRFLAAVEESKKKNLLIGIGLQRRHESHYKNLMEEIHSGKIGDIVNSRVYWNGGGIWFRGRQDGWTDMQDQCNNWYHFIWACGDQIVEQHIHNLDVGCWAKNAYPVSANGMGGWGRRLNGDGKESQIYDHTFVEYTFADGTTMHSQGRHLKNSFTRVGESAHGTKGDAFFPSAYRLHGQDRPVKVEGKGGGHQQEQTDFINALMAGEIYNEGEYGAKSTFTAILGREACYSGKVVKWDDLLKNGKDWCPGIDKWTWNTTPPAVKGAGGAYDIPKPGIYKIDEPLPAGRGGINQA
ncbi:MAG: Gfo/Idh/MocA family oxidoreductase [Phycisphaeraceae bacterium]